MLVVSITPQVSTSVNRSPTRIAPRSAFHQQRIGSDSTSPGRGARLACANAGPVTKSPATTSATQNCCFVIAVSFGIWCLGFGMSYLHLSQPAFGGEFNKRRFHLPAVEADADDVESRIARERLDAILPGAD